MAVCGIDLGNLSVLIGQTSKGGVDVILNSSSNRQSASTVSVQGKQRFIGDSGAAMARSNVKNTVSMMKLLAGRQYDDPAVQNELKKCPYKHCKMPNGGVGIEVSYDDQPMNIHAEHFLAMVLHMAKGIVASANNGVNVGDAVLAVPSWYTEAQRRAICNACDISNLNCLKVANETTLIALSYGIYKSAKKLFSETDPLHVMFIDIGYTGYQVTIVDFIQENMKVLATVCDTGLGGRDFDDVIIEYLAEQFEAKTKINVRNNIKAMLKLQAAAEKAKKTLTPLGVSDAPTNVECLAEDMDLNCILKRDEFEKRCEPLVARLRAPIEAALAEAKLTKEQIAECEIVGGTTRVGCVKQALGAILGLDASALNFGLKTTMNADEAVCRGGALQCAMLSSRLKVKPFNIVDKVPYGMVAHFDAVEAAEEGKEGEDSAAKTISSVALYSHGDDFPHKPRRLTFRNKTSDFAVTLAYDDDSVARLPPGENRFIAKFNVKFPAGVNTSEPKDVRITWNLDKNGFVYVVSAQLLEEVKVDPAEEKAAAADAKTDAKNAAGDAKDGAAAGASDAKADDKSAPDSKAAEDQAPAKKRFKKTDLEITVERNGMTHDDIKSAIELEGNMQAADNLIVETADRRNELEAYLYSMRDKIDRGGELARYGTTEEKEKLKAMITTAEDWLYNEGFDTTKAEYVSQLGKLKAISTPIEYRMTEQAGRPAAIEALKKQIEMCKGFCANYGEQYAHISEEDRDSIRKNFRATENWLYDMMEKQGSVAENADPLLTQESIGRKRTELHNCSHPIINKPKPKVDTPPPAPTPSAGDAKADAGDAKADAGAAPAPTADDKSAAPAADDKSAAAGESDSGPMEEQAAADADQKA